MWAPSVWRYIGVRVACTLPWFALASALDAQDVGGAAWPPGCAPEAVRCLDGPSHRWRAVDEPFGGGGSGSLDTGWQPPDGPVQVRFSVRFAGRTEVELEGRPRASWPQALSVGVEGVPRSGRLRIHHGVEVRMRLRFDLSVGGVRYRWEGDVPLGGVPSDLALRDEASFDSMAFEPAEGAEASDATGRLLLVRYDALSGLIDLPGVGGGVALLGSLRLSARYRTLAIAASDAPSGPAIEAEGGLAVRRPLEPFGATFDLPLTPEGLIDYDGEVVLVPAIYLSFPGGVRRDFELGEVPIPWRARREVRFDTLRWEVPLPDLEPPAARLAFGEVVVGAARQALLTLRNRGDAPLRVTLRLVDAAGFDLPVTSRQLPPRSAVRSIVRFAPLVPGPAAARLLVESDDPDGDVHEVMLLGRGVAPERPVEPGDAGSDYDAGASMATASAETAGGCGCGVTGHGGGSGAPWWGLLLLVLRRRVVVG